MSSGTGMMNGFTGCGNITCYVVPVHSVPARPIYGRLYCPEMVSGVAINRFGTVGYQRLAWTKNGSVQQDVFRPDLLYHPLHIFILHIIHPASRTFPWFVTATAFVVHGADIKGSIVRTAFIDLSLLVALLIIVIDGFLTSTGRHTIAS